MKVVTVENVCISLEALSDILCAAFDTWYGSAYEWCRVVQRVEPISWEFEDEIRPTVNPRAHYRQEYALNPGGALILEVDDEQELFRLDFPTIKQGLTTLVQNEEYRWCLEDIIEGNEDAVSASIFVQFCLFGKRVFL